ncbi:probable 20S rRNA accumulation protein 4 isoform X2 [Amaranthus tricolor]|uniref:probable 20S rRNA accumulation protein 4 isoform X2 n=1 Tax=Amaranthus tricolor TaxID=29722 RepID=UPI00258F5631|nr:probable 20S rRNA accumulation protein 4 isoform X2 [Amaranthus tricolor]
MKEVILGLPGSWAEDNLEIADHYSTKIGGLPDWPFPESSFGPDGLECCSCKAKLCLVSQVYAPIHGLGIMIEERVIYIFGCTNPPCESWRAIRVQKPGNCGESEIAGIEAAPSNISSLVDIKSLDESEDVGDDDDDDLNMEDLGRALFEAASHASKSIKPDTKDNSQSHAKALSSSPKTRKADSTTLVLPCFYLYNQEDGSSQELSAVCSTYPLLSDKDALVNNYYNCPIEEEIWEEEGYEYDKALNADRTYLKFKKRLDKCPEQCFRYSFGGKPLLATGDVGDLRPCSLCGEPRHFEMQLMSPLVYFLQERAVGGGRDLLENWNWMTLIVFTCSKSCFKKADDKMCNLNGWTVVDETVVAQFEKPLTESSPLGYFS